MKQLLSVWLVPVKRDKEYLGKIIKDLGGKYDAPVFVPHLTLIGDITINYDELKTAVDEIFKNVKPFKIKKTRINQSEKFFKTVFIEFELDNNLINLFNAISKQTDKRDLSTFKPHLSLIYKTMSEAERKKIMNKLSIKDEFTIGSVYVNAPKEGEKDFYDVLGWRTLYVKKLI